ncbi:MAG: hypothetical protein M3Q69_11195 [Acidobacteriota bacterium]|nr:hypothetical protein [Acidobacteriota bacterium]
MKRSVIALSLLVLLIATACASVTAPGTRGVITAVEGNSVTITSNGTATTYTLTNGSQIYSPSGSTASRLLLQNGQSVMVWSRANNEIVRLNVGA